MSYLYPLAKITVQRLRQNMAFPYQYVNDTANSTVSRTKTNFHSKFVMFS
ncbi:MAG: hypothetical protein RR387_06560 [Clostridiales bacterium]